MPSTEQAMTGPEAMYVHALSKSGGTMQGKPWAEAEPETQAYWVDLWKAGQAIRPSDSAATVSEAVREALSDLLPSPLCGEAWNLPDHEHVQISITFGKLKAARTALEAAASVRPAPPPVEGRSEREVWEEALRIIQDLGSNTAGGISPFDTGLYQAFSIIRTRLEAQPQQTAPEPDAGYRAAINGARRMLIAMSADHANEPGWTVRDLNVIEMAIMKLNGLSAQPSQPHTGEGEVS